MLSLINRNTAVGGNDFAFDAFYFGRESVANSAATALHHSASEA